MDLLLDLEGEGLAVPQLVHLCEPVWAQLASRRLAIGAHMDSAIRGGHGRWSVRQLALFTTHPNQHPGLRQLEKDAATSFLAQYYSTSLLAYYAYTLVVFGKVSMAPINTGYIYNPRNRK